MYRIFEVASTIDGEQVRENVLITWPDGGDLYGVLHKLGMEYALSPEGLKTCRDNGVTYNEVLSRLTPEMLAPYGAKIIRLDREAIRVEDKQIINRYELESHLEVMERDKDRERKMRDIAERYARKFERLKAEGHPLLSDWDAGRVSARAISWAYMSVRSGGPDAGKFFNERLADAVCKAGLSPQDTGGADEQNIAQSA